ncbi:hypothetical protein EBZ38_14885 [bacterium]|nr:hypothetical protein [bacterium]NDC96034.1 hypothetical protein [bacterium]NDD85544.1 hypothetical protein [bacterium]
MNVGILPPTTQYATPPRAVGGAPIRPAQTPGGIGDSLDWRRPSWQATQDAAFASVRAGGWQYGTLRSAATISAVSNNYVGTVLAQNGLVWATPFAGTGGLIFDSVNNATSVLGSFGGSPNFTSGVLMNDGRIFVIPRASTTARIVDPVNRTVTTPGGTFPGGNAYTGGCLCDGGRKIYLAASLQSTGGLYDIQRQALLTPAGTFTFDAGISQNATTGALLLPDGRVFCFPGYHTAAIYDPVNDSLFASSLSLGWTGSTNRFFGGVLLPSGDEILLVPQNVSAITIYNWRRDTARTVTGTATGHLGGQLMPDGSVLLIPGSSTAARVYRPDTDTLTTLPDTFSGSNPVAGAHVVPDGRLVMMPRSDSAVRTYGVRGTPIDQNIQLSPFFNHR